MNKTWMSFLFLGLVYSFTACSLTPPEKQYSKIRLEIPAASISKNRTELGEIIPYAAPSSIDGFTCLMVNVMSESIPAGYGHDRPIDWNAIRSGNTCAAYPGVVSDLIPVTAGEQSIELTIPSGPGVIVQILGFVSTIGCPSLNELFTMCPQNATATSAQYDLCGKAFPFMAEVGHTTLDVFGDSEAIIQNSYDPAKPAMVNCPTGTTTTPTDPTNSMNFVMPSYPTTGSKWNDYILNDGQTPLSASGTPCTGSEVGGYDACLHAGMIRQYATTKFSSCSGLSIIDTLGVFQWKCIEGPGLVTVYTAGLQPGKGLKDLVNETGWKLNQVVISDGANVTASEATSWWNDPIVVLPDNSSSGGAISLDTPHTIFVLPASRATQGYNINADGISVVTLGESALTSNVTMYNCDYSTAETGSNSRCLIASGAQKFLWIEGNYSNVAATAADYLVYVNSMHYSVLRNLKLIDDASMAITALYAKGVYKNLFTELTLMNTGNYGLNLSNSGSNSFHKIRASVNGMGGIYLNASSSNYFQDVIAMNNSSNGVHLYSSTYNTFVNVNASNNSTNAGVYLDTSSTNNVFQSILAANNAGKGVMLNTGSSYNVFTLVTAVSNASNGIDVTSCDRNTFHNIVSANNGGYGINIYGSTYATFGQTVVTNNASYGNFLSSSSYNKYTGHFLTGNNTNDCYVSGGTTPGLTGTTTCTVDGTSNYTPQTGKTAATSFSGRVITDDPINFSDSSGLSNYPSDVRTFDWFGFTNPWRAWSNSSAGDFDAIARGRWTMSQGQIRDWSVKATDTVIRNTTFYGSSQNTDPIIGSTCPTNGYTANVLTDAYGTIQYLRDAVELLGDKDGNEDGLCQNNETCLYTPNFGAYQGHGDLKASTCNYLGDTIFGVKMHFLPVNGF